METLGDYVSLRDSGWVAPEAPMDYRNALNESLSLVGDVNYTLIACALFLVSVLLVVMGLRKTTKAVNKK